MPMTTSNVPYPKGSTMADTRTAAEKAAAEREAEQKAAADKATADRKPRRTDLAPAGASGDPDVQRLLAQREAHQMNAQPDPSFAAQREAAEKALKDIDDALAELGYTAK